MNTCKHPERRRINAVLVQCTGCGKLFTKPYKPEPDPAQPEPPKSRKRSSDEGAIPDGYLTIKEESETYGIARRTIYQWRRLGWVARFGRLVHVGDIERIVEHWREHNGKYLEGAHRVVSNSGWKTKERMSPSSRHDYYTLMG